MTHNRYKQIREDFEFTKNGYRMTQEKLALIFKERNYGSLTHEAIRKIETGNRKVTDYELKGYCEVFNTTADYLLGIRPTKSVDTDITAIGLITGLSDESITLLKDATNDEKLVLDNLIKSCGLVFITNAIYEYFKSYNNKVEIKGYGTSQELSKETQRSVLEYINIEYTKKIFNMLTHEKEITNYFMRKTMIEWLEELRDITNSQSNNAEFIKKNNANFEKQIKEIEKTDYYKQFNSNK